MEGGWRLSAFGERECSCARADFLSAVDVWQRRPNVVNRRLLGAVEERAGAWGGGEGRATATEKEVLASVLAMEGGGAASEEGGGEEAEVLWRFAVRELLPRMSSKAPGREAILLGERVMSCVSCSCPIRGGRGKGGPC